MRKTGHTVICHYTWKFGQFFYSFLFFLWICWMNGQGTCNNLVLIYHEGEFRGMWTFLRPCHFVSFSTDRSPWVITSSWLNFESILKVSPTSRKTLTIIKKLFSLKELSLTVLHILKLFIPQKMALFVSFYPFNSFLRILDQSRIADETPVMISGELKTSSDVMLWWASNWDYDPRFFFFLAKKASEFWYWLSWVKTWSLVSMLVQLKYLFTRVDLDLQLELVLSI